MKWIKDRQFTAREPQEPIDIRKVLSFIIYQENVNYNNSEIPFYLIGRT